MPYLTRHARKAPTMAMGADGFDDLLAFFGFNVDSPDSATADDNVNQAAGGGTSTSAADFINMGSVCKPRNFVALNATRELQRQLNRVAEVKGFGKTAVDGAIGSGTLGLFRKVQSISAGAVMGDPSYCMGIAPDADVLGAQVKALADTLGAPATVSGPVALAVPTIVTKSGKTIVAPDAGLMGGMGAMSGIEKVALLGVAGGIGYLLLTKPKKRRK